MYLFVLLVAWIMGISTMGHILFERLVATAPVFYIISLLLLITGFLKFSLTTKRYFQLLKMGLIGFSVFFIGHQFALDSLQDRLEHRFNIVEERTEIVYISRLNEINMRDGQQSVKQIAEFADENGEESHSVLLYLNHQSVLSRNHY